LLIVNSDSPLSERSVEELAALAARFDKPGPRYTSYPTAVEFNESFGPDEYRVRLAEASRRPGDPLSIYIHIPFCIRRCSYCGCHTIATRKRSVADSYLDHLEREIDLVAGLLGDRKGVKVLHLGGGTPTYLEPAQIERLFGALDRRFRRMEGIEISSELDPRVTTDAHLRTLRSLGVNRVSLGVQDFDPGVQEAIGRLQSAEETVRTFRTAREEGFERINIDLVYGLPRQTLETMDRTLEGTISLRPDRVAVYGYAHVPWMRPNQKAIDPALLPGPVERLRLFLRAGEAFVRAGYQQIGMDHFALPEDDLAAAARARRLGRNFMGYTPHSRLEVLGLGISSIGHIAGAYAQNTKKLADYYRMVDAGIPPIERGYPCTADDDIRRHAIHGILCNFRLDFRDFEARAGIPFDAYFREEAAAIEGAIRDGLIARDPDGLSVTPLGRSFVRNAAMVLDRHSKAPAGQGPRFSRTV
jgi:oxygen-independent coproporphyrinogen-3 oxidase